MKNIKPLAIFAIGILSLTGCGNSNSKSKEPEEVGSLNFTFTTDLAETKEIHTPEQLAYLQYDGEYKTIDPNLYPGGTVHNSAPLAVDIEWDYTPIEGKEDLFNNFTVSYGQYKDLSDGYVVTAETTENGGKVSLMNVFMGTNYFKVYANYSDATVDATKTMTFEVEKDGPRNLEVDGFTNCRDMGGRVTEDGYTIKQGLVYRTCGNKFDYSTTITEKGKKEMLEHWKVKTEINVADVDTHDVKLEGTVVKDFFMDYANVTPKTKHHFGRNTESVKNIFETLADMDNLPVFYHCRIGTDRTGLTAILIYGLLGLSENEIFQDYLFSNFGNITQKRYIGEKGGEDNILNYIEQIEAMPGETFKNKVYNTLLSIGLSKETLAKVIENLLDVTEPLARNDANQSQVNADEFTGVTVIDDDSERNNPDHYCVLSNGTTATAVLTAPSDHVALYAYIGSDKTSNSVYLDEAFSVTANWNELPVTHIGYIDACLGNNKNNRASYYFFKLGELTGLTEGEDIEVSLTGITGTKANEIRLATLTAFAL
ncbi:MAG: tyrosine-protein phosphatase [Bacilli bacterium]|nr:tyrosine-protein phosphatase [Bacilli bacterium]